jgi:heterodisulfide reductase subunit D
MKLDLDIFRYRRPEGKELYRLSKNVLSIGIDEEDAWDIYSCANCGYCSACPIFKQFFLEEMLPRGKSFYFKRYFEGESQLNEKISGWIFLCTTCGRCEQVCQTEIPWVKLCEKIRASLQNFILPAHERIGKFSEEFHNPYGEKEHGFAKRKGGKIAYFAGCTSLYRMKNLAENSARILDSLGLAWITLGEDEWCCGSPLLRTGQMALAEKLILHNIESLNRLGAKKLITQCAGCYMTISTSWQEIAKKNGVRMGFRPMHLSVFLTREIENVEFSSIQKKITYHDPCHLGRRCKIYDEPRKILESIPGIKLVEMEAARENSECCGAGGGVRSAFPDVADLLAKKRVEQGMKTGAESIVSSCPFCELSFRLVSKVEVLDVVDLVSLALK